MANRPEGGNNGRIPQYQKVDYSKIKAKIDNKVVVTARRNENLEADKFERQRRARILHQKEERRKFEQEQYRKQQQQVEQKLSGKLAGQGEGEKVKEKPPKKCCGKIRFYSHKVAAAFRKRWLLLQGYYPPNGDPPESQPGIYEPPEQRVKDTTYARQLAAAMDIRIIRYPEPFAGLLLTSHNLEPKNYKIMFSQIILDADDRVTAYQACSKFPNEVQCLTSCLNCRKCKYFTENNVYIVHAPNGFVLGQIVRKRLKISGRLCIRFDMYDKRDELVLRIKKHCFCAKRNFKVVSPDSKEHVATIYRRIIPSQRNKQFPDHCDFRILFMVAQPDVEIKLLLIGASFFIDFLLDTSYRPFLRFGSKIVPTFCSRYSH
ncbi:unnamed protein product [Allacma fusca]|uniref:Phospholipid scramblase n=1 Tax=Allacma fusca TaxID=39272 RepID=A0A8J2K4E5_9HEXA|nr:unnamed protein product [Allacma fusca]